MADTRNARRTAERAAQKLLETTMISAAGNLGAAAEARTEAADAVTAAHDKGRELLAEAQRQADQLDTDARALVTTADTTYSETWTAAVTAGWTDTALSELGYTAPAAPTKTRKPRRTSAPVTTISAPEAAAGDGSSDTRTAPSGTDGDTDDGARDVDAVA